MLAPTVARRDRPDRPGSSIGPGPGRAAVFRPGRLAALGGIAAALALAAPGCGDNLMAQSDATPTGSGGGGAIRDASPVGDGAPTLDWVELAIAGCMVTGDETGDDPVVQPDASRSVSFRAFGVAGGEDGGVTEVCAGRAPLSLRFSAVASAEITIHDWELGDGVRSGEASPVHVYRTPGEYSVRLTVGGPGGTAEVSKPGLIVVGPAAFGGPCDSDIQCADPGGGECVCGDGASCVPGIQPMCSAGCSAATPCSEGVCGDLAAAGIAAPEEWQRRLCLPACEDDSDCSGELTCQEVPDGSGSGWVKGCFAAGLLVPMGASCFDSSGAPDNARCASGFCADLGARGVCSAPCGPDPCPPSSACADFTDGSPDRCVLRCDAEEACTRDPWLACEPADGPGPLGFTVDETAAAGGYCAPRTCESPAECGPDGACVSGFCQTP